MIITTLFFDLDGTLYPNDNGIWDAIAQRMEIYMHVALNLPREEIPALRKEYYQHYGTTLRGLQANFSFDEFDYLKFVHDIPLGKFLKPDKPLRKSLENLPFRKWVFTNSDRAHTERVIDALELGNIFEDIIDVTAMKFINKPIPLAYQIAIRHAGNPPPQECVFIEDSPVNLGPAKDFGMKTVLVGNKLHGPEVDIKISTIHQIEEAISKIEAMKAYD